VTRVTDSKSLAFARGSSPNRREKLMPMHAKHGIHVAPGEGEAVENPVGGYLTFKVRGEQSNGH
jgi:hypothetical protein